MSLITTHPCSSSRHFDSGLGSDMVGKGIFSRPDTWPQAVLVTTVALFEEAPVA